MNRFDWGMVALGLGIILLTLVAAVALPSLADAPREMDTPKGLTTFTVELDGRKYRCFYYAGEYDGGLSCVPVGKTGVNGS